MSQTVCPNINKIDFKTLSIISIHNRRAKKHNSTQHPTYWYIYSEQIRGGIEDNSKIMFLISHQLHRLCPSLEPSRGDGSNDVSQHIF